MDPAICARLDRWLAAEQLDGLLLSAPFSVDWAGGAESAIETGPNPFAGGPALLLYAPGAAVLLHPDCENPALPPPLTGRAYASYTVDQPMDPARHLADAFRELVAGRKNLGVEWETLPAPLAEILRGQPQHATFRACDGALAGLRMVKTAGELEKIRAALALCDLAQAALPRLVAPGKTELEIWAEMRGAIEARAGRRVPLVADFVSGPCTAEIGGPPTPRRLAAGEWLLADLVPRLGNYWGDCCQVIPAGEPGPRFRELSRIVNDALDFAISLVRPGAVCADLDRETRAFISRHGHAPYPHHTGHGIGVCYHEEPRLVPGNRTALAENMVIAIEPGIYLPGEGGVRVEDVVRVTATGGEVLTRHRRRS